MTDVQIAHQEHRVERRREGTTMALYIAICLLATFTAVPDNKQLHAHGLGIVWGITLGLAIAHWFSFSVSAGGFNQKEVQLVGAQLTGAAAAALLASVAMLVFPESWEVNGTELVLATFVAAVGYLSMRWSGTGRKKAAVFAIALMATADVIVEVKNGLAGY